MLLDFMVHDIVERTNLCVHFTLRDLRDNIPANQVSELFHVLRVRFVLELTPFLTDLAGSYFFTIVNQHTRILLERILCLQLASGFIESYIITKNISLLLFCSSK